MKAWRISVLLIITLLIAVSPVFADDSTNWGSDYTTSEGEKVSNPFSTAFRFLQLVLVSAATGALVSARFAINMVKAYFASDSSEGAYKKELVKFLTTIGIVILAGTILGYVTGWVTG